MTRWLVLAFAAAATMWGLASIPAVTDPKSPHHPFNTPMAKALLYSPRMATHPLKGELADNR
jgi:hypothetical protein